MHIAPSTATRSMSIRRLYFGNCRRARHSRRFWRTDSSRGERDGGCGEIEIARVPRASMQITVLALLLSAVFGLFVPSAQTRLRSLLHGNPRAIWAVPF